MRKNAFEKIVSAAASLALVVGLMPAAAFAEAGEGAAAAQLAGDGGATMLQDAATSGTWGSLTWTYDAATKTVTISGSGELTDGTDYEPAWKAAGLGDIAFEKVVLSEGITSIGYYAFGSCKSLTSVEIPSSVTSMDTIAFLDCTSLTSVSFADGSKLSSIANFAFGGCKSLTSVDIPASVTSIANHAFCDCESLVSVSFADGSRLSSIDSYVFDDCTSLTSIDIPASVTSIGDDAFYNCTSLTSVGIPASITSIDNDAFYGCISLASVDLSGCTSLSSIGKEAFYDCIALASVDFSGCASLSSIGKEAFYNCSALDSIFVPKSVISIGKYAFGDSSSKPIVYYEGSESDKAAATDGKDAGGSWVYDHAHSLGKEGGSSKAATCTEGGYTADTCLLCGVAFNYRNYVAALGHYMTETPAKAATATEAGTLGYFTCSRCGKVFADEAGATETTAADRVIPALGKHAAKRLAGDNAYGTMTQIVEAGWGKGSCDKVILATFDGYWDALAASGLAGIYDCPVLLTDTNSLSSAAKSEIERLGAKTVVIVGGTAAVSDAVESQVKSLGCSVERYAGSNAIGTSIEIYKAANADDWGYTCIVATVNGYYDALSASPYAYAMNAPIFLANSDGTVSAEVTAAIKAGGFKRVVVAGGTACVTKDAEYQLASDTDAAVVRRAGDNCFGTSVSLAQYCVDNGMSMSTPCFATGLGGYWDALAGASFAGLLGSPLLLVDDGSYAGVDFLQGYAESVSTPYIFGGELAVSASTEARINAAVA